jgi:hypothetical protein
MKRGLITSSWVPNGSSIWFSPQPKKMREKKITKREYHFMTKYTKYRTFCLPKEIVDLLFLSTHISPLENNKESEIIIGLTVVNDILSKSNQNRNLEDFPFHFIPMDAKRYLKPKYGNDYNAYMTWLIINNIIWHDFYYDGRTTYYYLQSMETYIQKINSLLKINGDKIEDVVYTYCLRDNIQITLESSDIKGVKEIRKSRIYDSWYKIKVPITKTNRKFLTKDYEADSKEINNAPTHVKKMGSYYRKNLEINYDGAIAHAEKQYQKELEESANGDEESKAFKRYSSRISSINNIHNGRNNKTLRFKRNPTNKRLDSNLTNMASDLRPFIVGYENMSYLDLSNSQPVLFNILLKKYREGASDKVIKELDRYLGATTSGQWYEELIRVFDITKYGDPETTTFTTSRNTAKKTWMLLAYSQNKDLRGLKKRFAEEYPFISSVMKFIKKENYEQFAIALQIIESEVFIDKICRILVSEEILPYTLHDGLLVPNKFEKRTLEVMNEVLLEEIGVVPQIKIENFKSVPLEEVVVVDSASKPEIIEENYNEIYNLISLFDGIEIRTLTVTEIIEITGGRYLHKIDATLFGSLYKKLIRRDINIKEFIISLETNMKT